MTCESCGDLGMVAFLPHDSTVAPDDATTDDLHYAVCLCPAGQAFRLNTNQGHKVAPQWVLWCARHGIAESRVTLVEKVYSAEELAEVGFSKPPLEMNRDAVMLAAGKRKK